ncbi:site-specific integrase [bacterium]|nr:site-specific integrase [bacterium]
MAAITKRISPRTGNISYRVQIRMRGYERLEATFGRLVDARDWAKQTESDLKAGRHLEKIEAKKHTLEELIDRYVRDIVPRKKSGAKQARQLDWWKEHYGKRLLSDINPALVTEARDLLKRTGGRVKDAKGRPVSEEGASNATVNRYLAALSHVFTIASKEWQWVYDNPVLRVSRLKEPRGRVRYLKDGEQERLLEACKASKNPDLYPAVLLALSTGARRMEIWGVRWEQVDFEQELIVLHDTKNQERRVLPIKGRALEMLRERSRVRSLETDLVFPSRKDPKKPMDFRAPWEKALKQAEIENFRWHDLRHSCASYLAMSGATPGEIAAVLGHKTLQMVKRYAHIGEAHTASVVERMNKRFMAEGA